MDVPVSDAIDMTGEKRAGESPGPFFMAGPKRFDADPAHAHGATLVHRTTMRWVPPRRRCSVTPSIMRSLPGTGGAMRHRMDGAGADCVERTRSAARPMAQKS
jgi:hypothetical protein